MFPCVPNDGFSPITNSSIQISDTLFRNNTAASTSSNSDVAGIASAGGLTVTVATGTAEIRNCSFENNGAGEGSQHRCCIFVAFAAHC
jgi:hypothetical protein